MSDQQGTPTAEGIKQNLSHTGNWVRLLLTLIYALIFVLGTWILGFVVLLSLLIVLFTGERNRNLVEFGGQLAGYLGALMRYATLNSDVKPFPFGEWSGSPPEADPEATPAAPAAPAPAAPAPASKKKAASKKKSSKVSKKTAPKSDD